MLVMLDAWKEGTSIEIISQRLRTIMAAVAKWRAGLGDGWYSSPHGVQILDYRLQAKGGAKADFPNALTYM